MNRKSCSFKLKKCVSVMTYRRVRVINLKDGNVRKGKGDENGKTKVEEKRKGIVRDGERDWEFKIKTELNREIKDKKKTETVERLRRQIREIFLLAKVVLL